jgi:predicted nucleic acid-binding Zn ribbon protein
LSAPAIQFKGSGWYVTDYARKPSPVTANGSAGSGDGDKGKSAADAKSEVLSAKESGVRSQNKAVLRP